MQALSIHNKSVVSRLWQSATFNTWTSLLVRSLNLVLLIPFVLRQFAPAEISLWYLFGTIISLNLLIDFGFSSTFIRFIAYAMGGAGLQVKTGNHPNRTYLQRVLGTQFVLFRRMSILLLVLLSSIGTITVYRPISFLTNSSDGWIAWCLIIIGTTISFYGTTYTVYLQGINRITELRRYETLFYTVAILSSLLALLLGTGLIGLVALNQFWAIVAVLRNRWMCFRYDEGAFRTLDSTYFDRQIMQEVWPSVWRSGIGVMMSFGVLQCSSLIYAQSPDVERVSSYLFAMRIIQIIVTFSQAPFYSKLPLLARLYAQHEEKQIITVAQKGMLWAHWTYIAGFAGVGLLAQPLMNFLGSNIPFVDPKLWALIGLAFFVERFGAMHIQLYSISNKIVWHIANGITGGLYLLLALSTYKWLGVYSFPISMLVAYLLFYSWYTAAKSYQFIGMNFWNFERRVAIPTVFAMIAFCLTLLSFTL